MAARSSTVVGIALMAMFEMVLLNSLMQFATGVLIISMVTLKEINLSGSGLADGDPGGWRGCARRAGRATDQPAG